MRSLENLDARLRAIEDDLEIRNLAAEFTDGVNERDDFRLVTAPVPCLFLAAHRHDENSLELGRVPIQRDVSAGAATDYELAPVVTRRPADLRVRRQNVDSCQDLGNAAGSALEGVLRQVIEDAVEVVEYLRKQLDPSHQRDIFRGRGRRSFSPRTRASK